MIRIGFFGKLTEDAEGKPTARLRAQVQSSKGKEDYILPAVSLEPKKPPPPELPEDLEDVLDFYRIAEISDPGKYLTQQDLEEWTAKLFGPEELLAHLGELESRRLLQRQKIATWEIRWKLTLEGSKAVKRWL